MLDGHGDGSQLLGAVGDGHSIGALRGGVQRSVPAGGDIGPVHLDGIGVVCVGVCVMPDGGIGFDVADDGSGRGAHGVVIAGLTVQNGIAGGVIILVKRFLIS